VESVIDLSLSAAAAAWGLDGFANPGGFRWRFSYRERFHIGGRRSRPGEIWTEISFCMDPAELSYLGGSTWRFRSK